MDPCKAFFNDALVLGFEVTGVAAALVCRVFLLLPPPTDESISLLIRCFFSRDVLVGFLPTCLRGNLGAETPFPDTPLSLLL